MGALQLRGSSFQLRQIWGVWQQPNNLDFSLLLAYNLIAPKNGI